MRYPDTPIFQSPAFLHEFLFLGLASELCAAIDAELVIDIVEMRAAPADESNPAGNRNRQAPCWDSAQVLGLVTPRQ